MNTCPNCHKGNDGSTHVDTAEPATPNPNDLSICFYCGAINKFDDDLKIVSIDDNFLNQIKEEDFETYNTLMKVSWSIKSKLN